MAVAELFPCRASVIVLLAGVRQQLRVVVPPGLFRFLSVQTPLRATRLRFLLFALCFVLCASCSTFCVRIRALLTHSRLRAVRCANHECSALTLRLLLAALAAHPIPLDVTVPLCHHRFLRLHCILHRTCHHPSLFGRLASYDRPLPKVQ